VTLHHLVDGVDWQSKMLLTACVRGIAIHLLIKERFEALLII